MRHKHNGVVSRMKAVPKERPRAWDAVVVSN